MSDAFKLVAPIARDSVEARVAQAVRRLIVEGSLPEGAALVERDLAERLGVSQTPVRIALAELERAGLVAAGQTGRAFVTRLTREDLEEIYAARRGLEGLMARLGAEAVGSAELGRMREFLSELQELADAQDVDGYLRVRWDFHAACYEAAGRPRLLAEVERLFWRSERYNRIVLSSPARFIMSVTNYRFFYEACEKGDAKGAAAVVEASTQWAADTIWESLPSEADPL